MTLDEAYEKYSEKTLLKRKGWFSNSSSHSILDLKKAFKEPNPKWLMDSFMADDWEVVK